nr:RNA-directed DNA polymerase, eukaryota, reverse transcriptase zinc-binding domain protein [Tanacetum cinerariifolium]
MDRGYFHVELDRRGTDLDSVLCPCYNNIVETCAHCLVTCDLAMSVWVKVFNWWKVGTVNAFSIDEFFSSNGFVNVPIALCRFWQVVIWTSGYFIWKERNARVFVQDSVPVVNVQFYQLFWFCYSCGSGLAASCFCVQAVLLSLTPLRVIASHAFLRRDLKRHKI